MLGGLIAPSMYFFLDDGERFVCCLRSTGDDSPGMGDKERRVKPLGGEALREGSMGSGLEGGRDWGTLFKDCRVSFFLKSFRRRSRPNF